MKERVSPAEYLKRMTARRMARGMDPAERNAAIVNGLRKYAGRFDRAGDPATGRKLNEAADSAAACLTEQAECLAAIEADTSDPFGAAVESAAGELRKRLPACFPSDEDAVQFARGLPLIEAKRQATHAADRRAALGKRATAAWRRFLDVTAEAAALATGIYEDATKATRKVAEAGRE
jgi:hypothetical protein